VVHSTYALGGAAIPVANVIRPEQAGAQPLPAARYLTDYSARWQARLDGEGKEGWLKGRGHHELRSLAAGVRRVGALAPGWIGSMRAGNTCAQAARGSPNRSPDWCVARRTSRTTHHTASLTDSLWLPGPRSTWPTLRNPTGERTTVGGNMWITVKTFGGTRVHPLS